MRILDLDRFKLHPTSTCIELLGISQVGAEEISYSDFFSKYLVNNVPCLLKGVSGGWESQGTWVNDGRPNFNFLREKYGRFDVPVADCQKRHYNSQTKTTMKFSSYIDYWTDYIKSNYSHAKDLLYLKDWHLANEFPEDNFYRVPLFFASDWLNEYLLNSEVRADDYRFVYMGPKGTWTPLHADVFSSFSWSVNISGKKKWLFFPPGNEKKYKDSSGELAYDVTDLSNDSKVYPNYDEPDLSITFIQDVGDAIFVPSGWHHQVWNLSDTMSVNHNWFNGCNIDKVFDSLLSSLESVEKEISDCQDMENWEEHCQLMLKSVFGMDLLDFCKLLEFVAKRRIECLEMETYLEVPGNWLIGRNQLLFDLYRVRPVLDKLSNLKLKVTEKFSENFLKILSSIEASFTC